jgi:hypothetical protein
LETRAEHAIGVDDDTTTIATLVATAATAATTATAAAATI